MIDAASADRTIRADLSTDDLYLLVASAEVLRAVAAGETIQVTNNGHVAAVISPPSNGSLDQLVAQGQVRLARRGVANLSAIRRRAVSRTSAELLADVRGRW